MRLPANTAFLLLAVMQYQLGWVKMSVPWYESLVTLQRTVALQYRDHGAWPAQADRIGDADSCLLTIYKYMYVRLRCVTKYAHNRWLYAYTDLRLFTQRLCRLSLTSLNITGTIKECDTILSPRQGTPNKIPQPVAGVTNWIRLRTHISHSEFFLHFNAFSDTPGEKARGARNPADASPNREKLVKLVFRWSRLHSSDIQAGIIIDSMGEFRRRSSVSF